jgi:hypothetical protein
MQKQAAHLLVFGSCSCALSIVKSAVALWRHAEGIPCTIWCQALIPQVQKQAAELSCVCSVLLCAVSFQECCCLWKHAEGVPCVIWSQEVTPSGAEAGSTFMCLGPAAVRCQFSQSAVACGGVLRSFLAPFGVKPQFLRCRRRQQSHCVFVSHKKKFCCTVPSQCCCMVPCQCSGAVHMFRAGPMALMLWLDWVT